MPDARFDLNIDFELAKLALQHGHLAEQGAELIAEEVKEAIELSDIPAAAGEAPHSTGAYRDSWKSGQAKRKRNTIVAWAFSLAKTESGEESLAEVLEEGRGPIHPHPHWRSAVERARRKLDALIARTNAQLKAGG